MLKKEALAKKLRMLIAKEDLSKREVAEAIGVDPATLSGYLKGKYMPGGEVLLKLAKILQISLDELVSEKEIGLSEDDELQRPFPDPDNPVDVRLSVPDVLPPGLQKIKDNQELREELYITDEDIRAASTARFYGGGADKLTVKDWLDIIKIIQSVK